MTAQSVRFRHKPGDESAEDERGANRSRRMPVRPLPGPLGAIYPKVDSATQPVIIVLRRLELSLARQHGFADFSVAAVIPQDVRQRVATAWHLHSVWASQPSRGRQNARVSQQSTSLLRIARDLLHEFHELPGLLPPFDNIPGDAIDGLEPFPLRNGFS